MGSPPRPLLSDPKWPGQATRVSRAADRPGLQSAATAGWPVAGRWVLAEPCASGIRRDLCGRRIRSGRRRRCGGARSEIKSVSIAWRSYCSVCFFPPALDHGVFVMDGGRCCRASGGSDPCQEGHVCVTADGHGTCSRDDGCPGRVAGICCLPIEGDSCQEDVRCGRCARHPGLGDASIGQRQRRDGARLPAVCTRQVRGSVVLPFPNPVFAPPAAGARWRTIPPVQE